MKSFTPNWRSDTIAGMVCPRCGEVFKTPLFEKKRHGLGVTFGGLGVAKCPKCGYEGPHGEFRQ